MQTNVQGQKNRKGIGKREGSQWNTRKPVGDDIYVHYLDCGNGFAVVYICQNL